MKAAVWLDRAIGFLSPEAGLRRARARLASELVQRHYEAASVGRRTQTWHRSIGDANAVIGSAVGRLRDVARDLERNNPFAQSALNTIVDHTVGFGIVAKSTNARAQQLWNEWALTTACDAEGRHDFAGLQKLVMRTMARDGEVLVRRRLRRPEDGLPIPMQLQVLEADYLDTAKDGVTLENGHTVINGVEFDGIGRRVAYWLFPKHPGSQAAGGGASERIPATGVQHMFRPERPGQVRAVTWFAPVLLRFKDFDELEDAVLMKQKIAAVLAVIMTDTAGDNSPLGSTSSSSPQVDMLSPGAIINVPPGKTIEVVQPPSVNEYPQYAETVLRSIATGLGITYEDLTGDFSEVNFSSARMARIRHWYRVEDWQWRLLQPQFLDPVWAWAMEVSGVLVGDAGAPKWTTKPMPMLEPDKEGLAYARLLRIGAMTWPEMIRERGYDPDEVIAEIAAWNKKFDEAGIVLDSDPRKTTGQGLAQQVPKKNTATASADDEDAAA